MKIQKTAAYDQKYERYIPEHIENVAGQQEKDFTTSYERPQQVL